MSNPIAATGPLQNRCPVDLHPLAPVRVTPPEEVRASVAEARTAQVGWAAIPFKQRVRLLRFAAKCMLEKRQEVLELLHDETGKTPAESLMTEAIGPLQLVNDCARVAGPYLAARRVPLSRFAFPGKSAKTEIVPRGVVGIIAPWNYPLAYFFKPVFPALLCGNAVVIKPSEHAPRTALWFAGVLNEFLPPGLVGVVLGGREAGQTLIRSGIDAVTFTGSFSSGKEVTRLAAEEMIPCSAELGGKDAAIVLSDCDLPRTVRGITQWALHNAGQSCAAIDRVYVEAAIADRFVEELGQIVSRLRAGSGDPRISDIGPLALSAQLEIVEALVSDALAKGAKLLCGGKRAGKGLWFEPTVLDHCNHTMNICHEPSFGPVIPIVRVADADEAVRLANDSAYGLCGSVWSQGHHRAFRIASQLQVGTAFINNHAFTGGVAAAPWTGVKQTGYGIANSAFALTHYTRPKTLVVDRSSRPDLYWFPITETLEELGHCLAEAQLGRLGSILKLPFLMRKRKHEVARGVAESPTPVSSAPRHVTRRQDGPPRRFRLPILSFELAWSRAAFETIFFQGNADPGELPALAPGEAERRFLDFYDSVPFITRIGVRVMIWTVGLAPIVYRRRLTPLHRLSPHERLQVVERMAKSDWFIPRQVTTVLKTLGAFSYLKTSRIQALARPAGRERAVPDRGKQVQPGLKA